MNTEQKLNMLFYSVLFGICIGILKQDFIFGMLSFMVYMSYDMLLHLTKKSCLSL